MYFRKKAFRLSLHFACPWIPAHRLLLSNLYKVWGEPALGKQVTMGICTASLPAYVMGIAAHQLL